MMTHGSNRTRWVAAVTFLFITGGVSAEDQLPPAVAAASSEDVVRIIAELDSVRDYERLRWLLDAIEQQVPPVRAELLKRLDDHVQQLFQAEVERRVASAVGSLAALSQEASEIGRPAEGLTVSSERTAADEPSDATEKARRPNHLPSYEYETISREVEALVLAPDPGEQRNQTSAVFRKIVNVEDQAKRMLLLQQLDLKKRAALQQTIETRKQELKQQHEAQQAAAVEMGGPSPNESR